MWKYRHVTPVSASEIQVAEMLPAYVNQLARKLSDPFQEIVGVAAGSLMPNVALASLAC